MKNNFFEKVAIQNLNNVYGEDNFEIKLLKVDREHLEDKQEFYSVALKYNEDITLYHYMGVDTFNESKEAFLPALDRKVRDANDILQNKGSCILFTEMQLYSKYMHETEIWPEFRIDLVKVIQDKFFENYSNKSAFSYALNDLYYDLLKNPNMKNPLSDRIFNYIAYKLDSFIFSIRLNILKYLKI